MKKKLNAGMQFLYLDGAKFKNKERLLVNSEKMSERKYYVYKSLHVMFPGCCRKRQKLPLIGSKRWKKKQWLNY